MSDELNDAGQVAAVFGAIAGGALGAEVWGCFGFLIGAMGAGIAAALIGHFVQVAAEVIFVAILTLIAFAMNSLLRQMLIRFVLAIFSGGSEAVVATDVNSLATPDSVQTCVSDHWVIGAEVRA